jgi:DNA gyrase subunit A
MNLEPDDEVASVDIVPESVHAAEDGEDDAEANGDE